MGACAASNGADAASQRAAQSAVCDVGHREAICAAITAARPLVAPEHASAAPARANPWAASLGAKADARRRFAADVTSAHVAHEVERRRVVDTAATQVAEQCVSWAVERAVRRAAMSSCGIPPSLWWCGGTDRTVDTVDAASQPLTAQCVAVGASALGADAVEDELARRAAEARGRANRLGRRHDPFWRHKSGGLFFVGSTHEQRERLVAAFLSLVALRVAIAPDTHVMRLKNVNAVHQARLVRLRRFSWTLQALWIELLTRPPRTFIVFAVQRGDPLADAIRGALTPRAGRRVRTRVVVALSMGDIDGFTPTTARVGESANVFWVLTHELVFHGWLDFHHNCQHRFLVPVGARQVSPCGTGELAALRILASIVPAAQFGRGARGRAAPGGDASLLLPEEAMASRAYRGWFDGILAYSYSEDTTLRAMNAFRAALLLPERSRHPTVARGGVVESIYLDAWPEAPSLFDLGDLVQRVQAEARLAAERKRAASPKRRRRAPLVVAAAAARTAAFAAARSAMDAFADAAEAWSRLHINARDERDELQVFEDRSRLSVVASLRDAVLRTEAVPTAIAAHPVVSRYFAANRFTAHTLLRADVRRFQLIAQDPEYFELALTLAHAPLSVWQARMVGKSVRLVPAAGSDAAAVEGVLTWVGTMPEKGAAIWGGVKVSTSEANAELVYAASGEIELVGRVRSVQARPSASSAKRLPKNRLLKSARGGVVAASRVSTRARAQLPPRPPARVHMTLCVQQK